MSKDYKVEKAVDIDTSYRTLKVKTAGLERAVSAFISNMDRVLCLGTVLLDIAVLSGQTYAILEAVYAKLDPRDPVEERRRQASETGEDYMRRWIEAVHKNPDAISNERKFAIGKLNAWLMMYPSAGIGVDAILAAVVTSTWTAFETLAGDLWVAAVNCHPKILSLLGSKNKDRVIPLIRLQDYDYDLSESMGTFLREAERVSFTRLKEIRNAYRLAFSAHGDKINKILDATNLDAISAVRNVIVHKAGICDQEYSAKLKRFAGLAPEVDSDKRIVLDGDSANRLVSAGCTSSVNLIQAVDSWLVSHP